MLYKITGNQPFQVNSDSFSISPSESGYDLYLSADGVNYSNFVTVASGVTKQMVNMNSGNYYILSGNTSTVTVNWERECGGGGGGTAGVSSLDGQTGALTLKTVNNNSLLGSGNIEISGGSGESYYTIVPTAPTSATTGTVGETRFALSDSSKHTLKSYTPASSANASYYVYADTQNVQNPQANGQYLELNGGEGLGLNGTYQLTIEGIFEGQGAETPMLVGRYAWGDENDGEYVPFEINTNYSAWGINYANNYYGSATGLPSQGETITIVLSGNTNNSRQEEQPDPADPESTITVDIYYDSFTLSVNGNQVISGTRDQENIPIYEYDEESGEEVWIGEYPTVGNPYTFKLNVNPSIFKVKHIHFENSDGAYYDVVGTSANTLGSISATTAGYPLATEVTGVVPESYNWVVDSAETLNVASAYTDSAIAGVYSIVGTVSEISSPNEGQLAYETTNHLLKVYDGTGWKTVQFTS